MVLFLVFVSNTNRLCPLHPPSLCLRPLWSALPHIPTAVKILLIFQVLGQVPHLSLPSRESFLRLTSLGPDPVVTFACLDHCCLYQQFTSLRSPKSWPLTPHTRSRSTTCTGHLLSIQGSQNKPGTIPVHKFLHCIALTTATF